MKRILFNTRPICLPWDEASKNFAYHLARNVRNSEIHLMGSVKNKLDDLPENVKQEPVYVSAAFDFGQKLRSIFFQFINKSKFDIVQHFFTPTKFNSFLIKYFLKSKKAKIIQTIATLREDLLSDEEIKKLMFGDKIITYSKYAKDKLEKMGFDNVEQIYPGINLGLYYPAPKDFALMSQIGISQADFVVVYPGEFTRLGNIDNFLKTIIQHAGMLNEKKIKIMLAFRVKNDKDFEKKEEIKKILREKNLESRILIPDTFKSLDKVFNLADAVIFPVENMQGKFDVPLAVVEAMACAKPVVLSDLPILSEFADEQISVKIKTGDYEELFKKILDVYDNRAKYEKLGKEARKFVEENFDIKKIAERYESIYKLL